MKKTITAAAIITALTFAGIQAASAYGNRYYDDDGYGRGYCGNYYNDSRANTTEDQAALEKFWQDTTDVRKEIVVKRSELNALMRQDNPDETKVAKLTGELYDLETNLDSKAEAAGIDNNYNGGYGPGMMRGYGPMMRGYGWGPGGHMMGW